MKYLAIFLASTVVAMVSSVIITYYLIDRLKDTHMMGRDMNKVDKPLLPEMGGLAVVLSFAIAVNVMLILVDNHNALIYASIFACLGAALVGIIDDIISIRQRTKALIPFILAIPLGIVINDSTIFLPIIGDVDFGWFIVLLVPFGVTCAANASNMLEGFNGLGTGLALIISLTLAIISIMLGKWLPLIILFPLIGALAGFMIFNAYPAKIFPGDTLTLFAGAAIACAAIIGDLKTVGAILFLPMIVEFFLKARGRFGAECWGEVDEKGFLRYEGRIESMTHLVMKWGRIKEWELVMIFWLWEMALAVVVVSLVYIRFLA
ncbi:MAG TPA: hypothetical protein ENN76_00630 [Euryarchaeota archaeon]|nr:hypothetical protein [Euryarchaeota archaeon]